MTRDQVDPSGPSGWGNWGDSSRWVRLNPAFDKRMRSIGAPHTGGRLLERGWIANNRNIPSLFGQVPGLVRFLYNPTELASSFPMNVDQPPVEMVPAALRQELPELANSATMYGTTSIDLLFDRTYEVAERSSKVKRGVYDDLTAFYRLLGIVWPDEDWPNHPLAPTNVWVYLGRTRKSGDSTNGSIRLQGVVTQLDTRITHWAYDMTPIRAAVSLQLTYYPLDLGSQVVEQWTQDGLITGDGALVTHGFDPSDPLGIDPENRGDQ